MAQNKKTFIELIFDSKPNTKNPIDLTFGGDGGGELPPPVDLFLDLAVVMKPVVKSDIVADPNMDFSLFGKSSNAPFGGAVGHNTERSNEWHPSPTLERNSLNSWGGALKIENSWEAVWGEDQKIEQERTAVWNTAQHKASGTAIDWVETLYQYSDQTLNHDEALDRLTRGKVGFSNAHAYDVDQMTRFNDAHDRFSRIEVVLNETVDLYKYARAKYCEAITALCGRSERPVIVPPLPPGIDKQYDLLFCHHPNNKEPIILLFGRPCDILPPKDEQPRAYILSNNVTIFRIDDGTEIKAISLDINIDKYSYAWSGTFIVKKDEYAKLIDQPIIEVNINHLKWRLKVEDITRSKRFNDNSITFHASSITTLLNDDSTRESHLLDTEMNAGQIAQRILGDHYEMEWGLPDWLIPANTYQYHNATIADRLSQLISAVKGVMISDHYLEKLYMRSAYPVDLWNIESAEARYALPFGKILELDVTDMRMPYYDSVIMRGEQQGILARAIRDGSAGQYPAPLFVNPLMTAEEAAREYARITFNESGAHVGEQEGEKEQVIVSFPMFDDLPALLPTDLLAINGGKGIIESVGVSAQFESALTIRNHITMERYK